MRTEAWTEEQLKCFHTKLFTQSPLAAVLKKPEKQDDAVSLVTQQAKYLRDVKRICATHHIPFPFKAESQSVNLASQIPESRSELKISDLSHVTNTEEWELNVNFAYNESLARILKIYKKQAKQSQVLEGLEKVIAG